MVNRLFERATLLRHATCLRDQLRQPGDLRQVEQPVDPDTASAGQELDGRHDTRLFAVDDRDRVTALRFGYSGLEEPGLGHVEPPAEAVVRELEVVGLSGSFRRRQSWCSQFILRRKRSTWAEDYFAGRGGGNRESAPPVRPRGSPRRLTSQSGKGRRM